MRKHYLTLTTCITASLLLSACGGSTRTVEPSMSKIDTVLARAAQSAEHKGNKGESLAIMERIYQRDANNPTTALKYAAALRDAGYLNRASIVLAPFAHASDALAEVRNEFTAIHLDLGHYTVAEELAQQAIIANEEDFKAFHHLGIALEAQGRHKEAERAFRKGLDYWKGDPTAIMNNLALNLASQGFLEESVEILQKAASLSPGRRDVERNLRIVNALQQTGEYNNAPKPLAKPVKPVQKISADE